MKIIDSGMPEEDYWSTFFSPSETLLKMGLSSEMKIILDLGCGYGTFTIPAAMMCPESTIYAIDIEDEMVATINQKANEQNLENITAIKRDFVDTGTGLDNNSIDYVMLFNILHAENPKGILSEALRVLKKGGKAGIIHWIYDVKTPRGPSLDIRPKPEQCREWALQVGFRDVIEEIELKPYHYGIILGA